MSTLLIDLAAMTDDFVYIRHGQAQIVHWVPVGTKAVVIVLGDHGVYEWAVRDEVGQWRHSDAGYVRSTTALRDGIDAWEAG